MDKLELLEQLRQWTAPCGCIIGPGCKLHRERAAERMRDSLNSVTAVLGTIVLNGRQIADPRMDGATDIYAVPLDDLERAHEPLTRSRALLRELRDGG